MGALPTRKRLGAIDTIAKRLEEARKSTVDQFRSENSSAMVLVNSAIVKFDERTKAVEIWTKQNLNLKTSKVTMSLDDGARKRGAQAAQDINLNNGPSLSSGTRNLLR